MKELKKEIDGILYFNNGDWIDLSNINKINKNTYSWKDSIGETCKFHCGDVSGIFTVNKILSHQLIEIKYNKKLYQVKNDNVKKCNLNFIVGNKKKDYVYDIGQVVNGLEILNTTRIKRNTKSSTEKGYAVKCTKDGYEYEIIESKLRSGRGCKVCNTTIVVKGINDIATTHPELVKHFVNKEDAYTNSYSSNKKLWFKCLDCGYQKQMVVTNFSKNKNITCNKCGDGVSFPNKFIFSLLTELGVKFIPEADKSILSWAENYRYDFYLPDYNIIIEADGEFHYRDNALSGKTMYESQLTDDVKDRIALLNGVYVIRVDFNYTNQNRELYAINTIKNNVLYQIFNINDIIIRKALEDAVSNRIRLVCNLYNEGLNMNDIFEKSNIPISTVRNYLNRGRSVGWCDYTPKSYIHRLNRVGFNSINWKDFVLKIDKNTMEIVKTFETLTQARSETGFSSVGNVLSKKQEHIKGYIFMYQQDWFKLQKEIYGLD